MAGALLIPLTPPLFHPVPLALTPLLSSLLLVTLVVIGGIAIRIWQPDLIDQLTPTGTVFESKSDGDDSPTIDEPEDDTDLVVSLVAENDGRMAQSEIVDRTGWSKSKVSVLLSEMDENNEIDKLRLGRENLISLPGHEPDMTTPEREE